MSVVWEVQSIETVPSYEGKEKVVANVTVIAKDVGSYSQKVGIDYSNVKNDPNFKPWSELTQEEVLSWAKNSLGVEMVQRIEEDVKKSVSEPILSDKLPWA